MRYNTIDKSRVARTGWCSWILSYIWVGANPSTSNMEFLGFVIFWASNRIEQNSKWIRDISVTMHLGLFDRAFLAGPFWQGLFGRAFLTGPFWQGLFDRAFLIGPFWQGLFGRAFLTGPFWQGLSERAFLTGPFCFSNWCLSHGSPIPLTFKDEAQAALYKESVRTAQ